MVEAPDGSQTCVIKSPCINVCRIDAAQDVCVGCYRTLDEIARWRQMTDSERDQVFEALPARRHTLGPLTAASRDEGGGMHKVGIRRTISW
jgi:hypothetical protein